MLQFAALEDNVHNHFVLVFQELACLVDLGLHIMVACLGTHAEFLKLLMMDFAFGTFPRLLVAELAIIENLADRWFFGWCDFDQIQTRLSGMIHGHRSQHNSQLLAVRSNQANRTDTDLIVDSQAPVLLRLL